MCECYMDIGTEQLVRVCDITIKETICNEIFRGQSGKSRCGVDGEEISDESYCSKGSICTKLYNPN